MRILQVTNIISHHQLPLARSFLQLIGKENFRFAAIEPPSLERQKLGWNCDEDDPWILRASENDTHYEEYERWWNQADVVLCGHRLFDRVKERLGEKKLTFYMAERWWKPPIGKMRLFHPRFALMAFKFMRMAASPFFHYLPMGAYSSTDIKWIASFHGRMWEWAYFTDVPEPLPPCNGKEEGFKVLWAGRMLNWKQVDTIVRAFSVLLEECQGAKLTLVGEGPERSRLERLAAKLLTANSYTFHNFMPAPEVRQLMQKHHVYVLSSNGEEGWGAVANEAMSEGCTLIASDAAGASRVLIRNGENGLLFPSGDWNRLGKLLCRVNTGREWQLGLAAEGQKSISSLWSPANAAERFLQVSQALLAGDTAPDFKDGPMVPL